MSGLLTPSRLRAIERIGVGLYVLAAVLLLGREIINKVVGTAAPAPSPTTAAVTRPTTTPSFTPAISPTPPFVVTAAPSPSSQPTPTPLLVYADQNGGLRFADL